MSKKFQGELEVDYETGTVKFHSYNSKTVEKFGDSTILTVHGIPHPMPLGTPLVLDFIGGSVNYDTVEDPLYKPELGDRVIGRSSGRKGTVTQVPKRSGEACYVVWDERMPGSPAAEMNHPMSAVRILIENLRRLKEE